MAFSTSKELMARQAVAAYAETTLAAYLQGQERRYALEDVIAELGAVLRAGAIIPVALIRQGMECEDEERRAALIEKAMEMIVHQTRDQLRL